MNNKKIKILFILIMIVNSQLFAQTSLTTLKNEIDFFYDQVMNNSLSDEQQLKKYQKLKKKIATLDLDCNTINFLLAQVAYIQGRYYMTFDNVQTAIKYNKAVQKGKFINLFSFYDQGKKSALSFENALSILTKIPKEEVTAEIIALKSDCISQLCLVKNPTYTLGHGLSVNRLAKKALKLDPQNIQALLITISAKVYAPPIYGGNPEEGINELTKLQKIEKKNKVHQFNILSGLGYCYYLKKDYKKSKKWLKKALIIYPNNTYTKALLDTATKDQ